jgi:hypothetical protein
MLDAAPFSIVGLYKFHGRPTPAANEGLLYRHDGPPKRRRSHAGRAARPLGMTRAGRSPLGPPSRHAPCVPRSR